MPTRPTLSPVSYAAAAISLVTLASTFGCGSADFIGKRSNGSGSSETESATPSGTADAVGQTPGGATAATDAQGEETATASGTATGTSTTTTAPTIPDAAAADLPALHACMAAWPNSPFTGTVTHYKKISAAVSVGGTGAIINDAVDTPDPELVLIDAGVNVFGTPEYNLLNKNGYYCLKVGVNVLADLTVNLHCNARLADSRVTVNVLSNQNDTTAGVGVAVMSNVQVETVRPQGDACIR